MARAFSNYLAEHPEQAKIFDAAMTGFHGPETQAMIDAYDYSGINTLVDIRRRQRARS